MKRKKIKRFMCFPYFKVINKLINYYSQHMTDKKTRCIYKQVIDLAEVFWGEPLNGLHKGVLKVGCLIWHCYCDMNEVSCRKISEFVYSVWCETRIRFAHIQRERRHLSFILFCNAKTSIFITWKWRIGCRWKK
jgi:hypothetical protein